MSVDTSKYSIEIINEFSSINITDGLEVSGGDAYIRTVNNSSSTTNGALIVLGGAGINKDVNIGGNLNVIGITSSNNPGHINLGTKSDVTLNIKSSLGTDFVPKVNAGSVSGGQSLGSVSRYFNNVYTTAVKGDTILSLHKPNSLTQVLGDFQVDQKTNLVGSITTKQITIDTGSSSNNSGLNVKGNSNVVFESNKFISSFNEISLDGRSSSSKISIGTNTNHNVPIFIGAETSTVTVFGSLNVQGSLTYVESVISQYVDNNIEIGLTKDNSGNNNYNDTTALNGGITLKGSTDKTLLYLGTNTSPGITSKSNNYRVAPAWISSENFDITKNKHLRTDKVTSRDVDGLKLINNQNEGLLVTHENNVTLRTLELVENFTTPNHSTTNVYVTSNSDGTGVYSLQKKKIFFGNTTGSVTSTVLSNNNKLFTFDTNSGKIGVGTTTPESSIDVQGTGSITVGKINLYNDSNKGVLAHNSKKIFDINSATSTPEIRSASDIYLENKNLYLSTANSNSYIKFDTNRAVIGGSSAERMAVFNDGGVSIGTITKYDGTSTLTVLGDTVVKSGKLRLVKPFGGGGIELELINNATDSQIKFYNQSILTLKQNGLFITDNSNIKHFSLNNKILHLGNEYNSSSPHSYIQEDKDNKKVNINYGHKATTDKFEFNINQQKGNAVSRKVRIDNENAFVGINDSSVSGTLTHQLEVYNSTNANTLLLKSTTANTTNMDILGKTSGKLSVGVNSGSNAFVTYENGASATFNSEKMDVNKVVQAGSFTDSKLSIYNGTITNVSNLSINGSLTSVLQLAQDTDTSSVIKIKGKAVTNNPTKSLVVDGSAVTKAQIKGYFKVTLDDVNNVLPDGDYYIPLYKLT
jgi:hypothetical protein